MAEYEDDKLKETMKRRQEGTDVGQAAMNYLEDGGRYEPKEIEELGKALSKGDMEKAKEILEEPLKKKDGHGEH